MWCFDCKKDVSGVKRQSCYDDEHDLDYEMLFGPWRIKPVKIRKKSTLKFKKKIDMTTEVPYE